MERPLGLTPLQRAADLLRPHLDCRRTCTKDDIRNALGRLGGFLARTGTDLDPRWRLLHPMLGAWFSDLHGTDALRSALRDALAPLGAVPDLDDPTSLAAWMERVLEYEPAFKALSADQRTALLERLLDGLPDGERPLPELAIFGHRRAGLTASLAWELHQAGKREEAAALAVEARERADELLRGAKDHQRIDVNNDQAFTWSATGLCRWYADDFEGALEASDKSVTLREAIRSNHPTLWNWRRQLGLATEYGNRGSTLNLVGRSEDALTDFSKAIELADSLDGEEPEVREKVADVHHKRGFTFATLKRDEEALADYDRAIELCSGLDQDKPDVREKLAAVHSSRAIAFDNRKRYKEALADYDRAIELRLGLDQAKPEVRESLARVHLGRGIDFADLKHYQAALADYDRAIELRLGLDLDDKQVRENLASTHELRGITLTKLKRHEQALEEFARSIEIRSNLDRSDPQVREKIARTYQLRLGCLFRLGRFDLQQAELNRMFEVDPRPCTSGGLMIAAALLNAGIGLGAWYSNTLWIGLLLYVIGSLPVAALFINGITKRQLCKDAYATVEVLLAPWLLPLLAVGAPMMFLHRRMRPLQRPSEVIPAFGDSSKAISQHDYDIASAEALDQQDPAARARLAQALDKRSIALAGLKRWEAAHDDSERAIELRSTLNLDEPLALKELADSHRQRGLCLSKLGRMGLANRDQAYAFQLDHRPCNAGSGMVLAAVVAVVLGVCAWLGDAPWIGLVAYAAGSAIAVKLFQIRLMDRQLCNKAYLTVMILLAPWLIPLLLALVIAGPLFRHIRN